MQTGKEASNQTTELSPHQLLASVTMRAHPCMSSHVPGLQLAHTNPPTQVAPRHAYRLCLQSLPCSRPTVMSPLAQ